MSTLERMVPNRWWEVYMKIIALVALISGLVMAETYRKMDANGNTYIITKHPNGTVSVQGYNLSTGSSWNQTRQPDGTYFGQDAKGNYYRGNKSMYYNSNGKYCTGGMCFGN